MIAIAGFLAFSLTANSAEVTHVTLEVDQVLGIPAVQGMIVSCIGEEVFFTGTVRMTLKDNTATHFNWAGVTGETLDGDLFVGGSGVNVGKLANLTLVEVGAGNENRQFHVQIVDGEAYVLCHD